MFSSLTTGTRCRIPWLERRRKRASPVPRWKSCIANSAWQVILAAPVAAPQRPPDHQPPRHRAYAERTPERFAAWAEKIGPSLLTIVQHQFDRRLPMLGLPACDSLKRLAHQYGADQLESAARRALEIKSLSVKSVRSLLQTGRHAQVADASNEQPNELPSHHNVRGPDYYMQGGAQSC